MRYLALVLLLGCGAGSREPAWPKQHDPEADGGESLAPHGARSSSVAAVADDDDKPAEAAPAVVVAKPAAATEATPAAVTPAATPTDDTLQGEEIIIEVDD
ncbi:MAG: hypothetical protein QM831_25985 [Kofleriaceae bacterium]